MSQGERRLAIIKAAVDAIIEQEGYGEYSYNAKGAMSLKKGATGNFVLDLMMGKMEIAGADIGHLLGNLVHEGQISPVLLKNYPFTFEPGIYKPGVGAFRTEVGARATEEGVEIYNIYTLDRKSVV